MCAVLVISTEADRLLIENVAVRPDLQGTGIGLQLLDFADQRAAASGLRELRLYTHETMTENIEFYAQHRAGPRHTEAATPASGGCSSRSVARRLARRCHVVRVSAERREWSSGRSA